MKALKHHALTSLAGLVLLLAATPTLAGQFSFGDGFEEPLDIIMLEPPVALQAAGVNATAHVGGLYSAPFDVRLIGPGATVINPDFEFTPGRLGLLQIDIPTGLATGAWDLEVEETDQGEVATLAGALQVVNDASVGFDFQPGVFPSDGGGLLRLDSDDEFDVVSQVLLRPQGAPASEPALRLRGVDFKDVDRIFAPIPPGLPDGDYDVFVINSDGTAGQSSVALAISPNPAPAVSNVFPGTIPVSDPAQFSITGSGFVDGLIASLTCEDENTQALSVTFMDSTAITADYAPGALSEGLCIVDVINPDGQDAAWASIRLRSAAGGVGAPVASAAMLTARRAPALALHRVNGEGFSLYAIGGDDGTDANALASVEIAEVGEFGGVDGWVESLMTLPAGRSFAWAGQFGEFIYLLGGFDGTSAVDTVYRAQILNQDAAPNVLRHTLQRNAAAPGFAGGIQAYRVSAIFPADDATNPNGQSLAGDARNVFVPNQAGVALRLEWAPVPGASGYRVYTNAPGGPYDGDSATLELLATTAATAYVHMGGATDPLELPLAPGETGTWHQVPGWALNSARSHFAGTMAPLPGAPGTIVLYALGGDDDVGDRRSDYAYSVVTAADTPTPGYGAFLAGSDTLAEATRSLAAWTVIDTVADESWVFAGTGLDGSDQATSTIERGLVTMSGELDTLAIAGTLPAQGWAGASALAASGSLALAGGQDAASSATIRESFLSDSGSGPETGNWNAPGFSLLEPRIHAGTAHGAVFIFIAGGADDMGAALGSVELMTR